MKIKSIAGEFAQVEAAGLKRRANIQMLPKARVGDYVIVHAGFAIEIVEPEAARRTLKEINEIH